MNTSNSMQEQISAFADGELPAVAHAPVLAALRAPAERAVWDEFHHIGDILRSVEMAAAVRPDFAARMTMRLASEPTYLATAATVAATAPAVCGTTATAQQHWLKRFAMPGAAVAAAVVLTVVTVPRMAGLHGADGTPDVMVSKSNVLVLDGAPGSVVLRDPRMEEYLLAHQRFSPSVFSTAQFARSATFATDSLK